MVKAEWREFYDIPAMLRYLRELVNEWRGRAWTRETAMRIVFGERGPAAGWGTGTPLEGWGPRSPAGCKQKDKLCHVLTLGRWVQRNLTYVNELPETFQTPKRTFELGAGDCDDFTTFLCATAESLGVESQIVGMKVSGKWQHVFPMFVIPRPGQRTLRVPMDATLSRPVDQFVNPIKLALSRGKRVETLTL